MAFRVQDFRAQLQYDGARPNLFNCELTFPTFANPQGAQQKYTFMAKSGQLPSDVINQIPQFYFGRELKFAGNRTFPEWTVTIINDEDFIIRDAFERWMSGINSHVGNLRTPEFERGDGGYQQDGFITQFGKMGDVIKAYKFVGMFPIEVSLIELDWGANDAIEEYSVTFAYQWWEHDSGTSGPTTDTVGSTGTTSPILPVIP